MFDQNSSWQANLRWQPAEELTPRANYAEVFRVPTIVELYDRRLLAEDYFDIDPCGNDPTPKQQANCAANGVPGGAYVQGDDVFPVPYGGNPDLDPETGYSFGAGSIYTPAWAKRLSASVDYFQIELIHYIFQAFPYEVLFECAERGTREACEDIRRFPDGSISQVSTLNDSFGGLEVRGVDFAIDWPVATRLGEVNSRLLATYLDRWDVQPFPAVRSFHTRQLQRRRPAALACVGTHRLALRALDGQLRGRIHRQLLGTCGPRGASTSSSIPINRRVDPILYHDLEAGFQFDSGVSVRAAITNVTDEDPPYLNVAPANTNASTYRLLGRSDFLELRYQVE